MREFILQHSGQEARSIHQFHFKAWPDHMGLSDPNTLLSLLDDVNDQQGYYMHKNGTSKVGPIVVHGSAGIGRTGTFIVIDILLNVLKAEGR